MKELGQTLLQMSLWSNPPDNLGWIVAAILLIVCAALFFRALRERQHNRRIMTRLDELEEKLSNVAEKSIPAPEQPIREQSAPRVELHPPTPTGDVLAGFTTQVRQIVAGGDVQTLEAQAIRRIHERLDQGITPQILAETLHVSLRTLERGLAHALDCTPRQLILAMKMREARRLLADGGHRVKDVAMMLGFADQYHFSRCFKAFYRVAPSDARQKPAA